MKTVIRENFPKIWVCPFGSLTLIKISGESYLPFWRFENHRKRGGGVPLRAFTIVSHAEIISCGQIIIPSSREICIPSVSFIQENKIGGKLTNCTVWRFDKFSWLIVWMSSISFGDIEEYSDELFSTLTITLQNPSYSKNFRIHEDWLNKYKLSIKVPLLMKIIRSNFLRKRFLVS